MTEVLERRFAAIGARVDVRNTRVGAPSIDVHGETFVVEFDGSASDVEVVDVDARGRHLLLLVRSDEKSKFLSGHDERDWFVAAIPEAARGVTGVRTAKAALQPDLVRSAIGRANPKDPFRRRNAAYVRQGEWFFVPAPEIEPRDGPVHRDEPLTRGRGKAHVLQFAYRTGGTTLWVNRRFPTGISEQRYARLTPNQRKSGGWVRMVRDPELFARGAVRHPDHATIHLNPWHRVVMNTEQGARAMRHVAFLD